MNHTFPVCCTQTFSQHPVSLAAKFESRPPQEKGSRKKNKLISSTASTHSMTIVPAQLLVWRLGARSFQYENVSFHATRRTGPCLMEMLAIDRSSFRKKDVKCTEPFLALGAVTISKTKCNWHVRNVRIEIFSLVHIKVDLSCNIGRSACILSLHCSMWYVRSRCWIILPQTVPTHVRPFFVSDSDPELSRWDHPLS